MAFKIGKKKKLFEGKFIKLWSTEFLDKAGKPQVWEYIKKEDIVAVLPVTNDGKAVLIKNYRVPVEKYVIETPAGLTDKTGEKLEDLARRELLEETGYAAEKFHRLPDQPFKAAESENMIYGFVATGLTKVREEVGDATEDISVIEVPLKDLPNFFLDLPPGVLFNIEILGMYEMARFLKILP